MALEHLGRATALGQFDPLSFKMHAATGYAHFFSGRYDLDPRLRVADVVHLIRFQRQVDLQRWTDALAKAGFPERCESPLLTNRRLFARPALGRRSFSGIDGGQRLRPLLLAETRPRKRGARSSGRPF